MKLNWIIIFCALAVVAATFSLAVIEGANVAVRDTAAHSQDRLARAQ